MAGLESYLCVGQITWRVCFEKTLVVVVDVIDVIVAVVVIFVAIVEVVVLVVVVASVIVFVVVVLLMLLLMVWPVAWLAVTIKLYSSARGDRSTSSVL